MKTRLVFWSAALTLFCCGLPTLAQKKPMPATYTNPVWNRDFPDPFVIRHNGRFYAYATETGGVKGFQVLVSDDLVHWTHKGTAFTPQWATEHYWAPEVVFFRGQFYMTYSALNPATKKHDIGIATSKNPLGPFVHRAILAKGDANKVGVIDATIFFDTDHKPYLLYSEEDPRRIVIQEMRSDLFALQGELTEVVRPTLDGERGVTEAPTLLKRNGVYHLFYSVGWFQSNKADACYAVCEATAKNVRGPYTKSPKPLLATKQGAVYGPGHQCLVTLPGNEMWLVYHAWDNQNEPRYGSNPSGRTLWIDRLRWNKGKPVVSGPSTAPRPAPKVR